MSSPSKLHDPLFHYETHFPERLSRLHLGNEFGHAASFKKLRKTRQRAGLRYKTQPVTFDEITEVDEEPEEKKGEGGSAEGGPARSGRGLMGQFQAFSRSMDGLLPRIPEQYVQTSLSGPARRQHQHQHHHPHPDRPPSIPSIPERVETGGRSPGVVLAPAGAGGGGGGGGGNGGGGGGPPSPSATHPPSSAPIPIPREDRLQQPPAAGEAGDGVTAHRQGLTPLPVQGSGGEEGGGGGGGSSAGQPPVPSPNIGSRRQKVTAKAKKRQKAAGDHSASDT